MVEISDKILCVDDQPEITQLLAQQLSSRYAVSFANGAVEALQRVDSDGPFAVMLVDYAMPEMNGVELLREVQQRSPETVSIMLTAFADVSVAVSAMHDASVFRFVRKPWDPNQLRGFLDEALERYRVLVSEHQTTATLSKVNQRLHDRIRELEGQNAAFQRRLTMAPGVVYEATVDENAVTLNYVSPVIEAVTGRAAKECLEATDPWHVLVGGSRAAVTAALDAAPVDTEKVQLVEHVLQHRGGDAVTVHNHFRKFADSEGRVRVVGIWLRSEII